MAIALKTPLAIETDDDLARVSRENPGYRFEREEDGTVIVSPTHTKGGAKSLEAGGQLRDYKKRAGGNAYDPQTGFAIGPAKKLRSPNGAWVGQARIDALTEKEAAGYWPLSPAVAIEVKSDTDIFEETVETATLYIPRGSSYAVAIDPTTREVVELGTAPAGIVLDFDGIIEA
jgi:Uma2 family endonuclease